MHSVLSEISLSGLLLIQSSTVQKLTRVYVQLHSSFRNWCRLRFHLHNNIRKFLSVQKHNEHRRCWYEKQLVPVLRDPNFHYTFIGKSLDNTRLKFPVFEIGFNSFQKRFQYKYIIFSLTFISYMIIIYICNDWSDGFSDKRSIACLRRAVPSTNDNNEVLFKGP